jgi:O-antigen ligase
MIYAVVAFPYFNFKGGNLDEGLFERVSGGSEEAALASRWSLLPELWSEIKKYPFSGQGFGTSVTYISSDPRVLQNNPSGEYTTSAFEWGYLDIWLKIGFGGLLTYLFLLIKVIFDAFKKGFLKRQGLYFGLSIAILFLVITNAFTPYLNHPLGIGLFLFASCLIYKNEVY